MAIERVFLGWDEPAIHLAARWLRQRYARDPHWDMHAVLIVVPGRRAGRRLIEVMVDCANGLLFVPPTIITLGDLPERLYSPTMPIADDLRVQLARLRALRSANRELLSQIVSQPPADHDLTGWLALSNDLAATCESLAAEAVPLEQVPDRCQRLVDFTEDERWHALAILQNDYEDILTQSGYQDRHLARINAIENCSCSAPCDIVLLATVDLNRVTCLMLEQIASSLSEKSTRDQQANTITALIHAPEVESDNFDTFGAIHADRWLHRQIDIPIEIIHAVDSPSDQAHTVLDSIATLKDHGGNQPSFAGPPTPDQITIGLGDQAMGPMIQRTLSLAGIPARHAAGGAMSLSRPALLLAATARYIATRCFDDFGALLRHPDLEDYLTQGNDVQSPATSQHAVDNCLTLLDQYLAKTLQHKITGHWLAHHDEIEPLKQAHAAIESLLPNHPATARPLPHWSSAIAQLLTSIYGQPNLHQLFRHREQDEPLIRALEAIAQILREQTQLDPADHTILHVTFTEAIQLTLTSLAKQNIPADSGPPSIELLGWLELHLDDASSLIITGVNEGCIPAGTNADAFLPDSVRRELDLPDSRRRYARDLMILTAILHSRPSVTLIAGKRGHDDNPLSPSRLLLACDQQQLPKRIEVFYPRDTSENNPVPHITTTPLENGGHNLFLIPHPHQPDETINRLRVTGFKDYLACPYRFYLKHVLKLRPMEGLAIEMDGKSFGNLTHGILSNFGQSDLANTTSFDSIDRHLQHTLDRLSHEQFGPEPIPAIVIQRKQLGRRLSAFARWQVQQAQAGWRIDNRFIERSLQATLHVDDQPFLITARIDRIDQHDELGCRIVDYKTADTMKSPEQTHRHGPKGQKQWIDLQLPLYQTLATEAGITGPLTLGYVHLSKDLNSVQFDAANWSHEDLQSAVDVAHEVIRKLRRGIFFPPSDPAVYDDGLAAICMDPCINRSEAIIASSQSEPINNINRPDHLHGVVA